MNAERGRRVVTAFNCCVCVPLTVASVVITETREAGDSGECVPLIHPLKISQDRGTPDSFPNNDPMKG